MTNLLFSILTVLVTNTTEVASPTPQYSYILPSYPPQYFTQPKTKSVYSTCHRITNRVDTLTGTPVTIELGRALVWSTTENFTEVTEWRSSGVVTNPVTETLSATNYGSYGIQWNSNSIQWNSNSIFSTNLLHVSTNDYSGLNRDYFYPTNKLHVNHSSADGELRPDVCGLCREIANRKKKTLELP